MNSEIVKVGLVLLIAGWLAGCASTAAVREASLRLPESSLEIRNLQSHKFMAPSETDILAASIAVLQDMEYNVDHIETPLGVISASKRADADSFREKSSLFIADLLCGCDLSSIASDEQLILLTLTVQPSVENADEYVARVTLQRVVYDTLDRIKLKEPIHEPELYQKIFARLSKSIFLETEM